MDILYLLIGLIVVVGIVLLVSRHKDCPNHGHKGEDLTFFDPVNYRYWPQYNNTYPLNSRGNQYPENLLTRMNEWSPGFNTSGWKYALRPGVYASKWPRSRWVKNDINHSFINNGHFGIGHDYVY